MSAAYRIAFIFASAFALAFSALGVAVYVAADAEFRGQRDRDIAREVNEMSDKINRTHMVDEIGEREAETLGQRFGYALFDPRVGRQVAGALRIAMPRPGVGWADTATHTGAAGHFRIKAIDLHYGDRLVVGIDSQQVDAVDAAILELFGIAFVAVLAISVSGGALLARYLRRRLDTIGGTARAIVAGELNQRVPLTGRDDEFEQAARAVNAMLDRIAQLMDNLRQVSSDIAHDLRTPLMRLRSALDRLPAAPAAARAREEGDAILALFNAILRINEVEGGALSTSFAPIDLSRMITDLGESYELALADDGRHLAWDVQPGIRVSGHRELLAQAIINLLDNCRLHTPPGTEVTLRLTTNGDEAVVEVADNGPGIPAADRPRMLKRFVRGDGSRSTPGSGLGLALVAAIARAHRGDVVLAGAARGLIVTVTLPRLVVAPTRAVCPEHPSGACPANEASVGGVLSDERGGW